MSIQVGDAVSKSKPVAETFDEEIEKIKEGGKDLKGDQREFFNSIVQRLENNNQVLKDLRAEHTQSREHLALLVKEKNQKQGDGDLASDIKLATHEVNKLKMQIDKIKDEREKSLTRQKELEMTLANLNSVENAEHPEEERITNIRNRLDKVNIKAGEAQHLEKIYLQIINLYNQQKTRWNRILKEKQDQIAQKQHDIADLTLISRDSRFSRDSAQNEYNRTEKQISEAKARRDQALEAKKNQFRMMNLQTQQNATETKPAKPQPSLTSQPSILRNRANKQLREKREEKFRLVSSQMDDLRDHFGNTDPEKIKQFFAERRNTTQTLNKQIEELKSICKQLEQREGQLRGALEEAEFASSKGVGGNRLLIEGRKILKEKQDQLYQDQRQVATFEDHEKSVAVGVNHLQEIASIVQGESEEAPTETLELLKWVRVKAQLLKSMLSDEDTDWEAVTNRKVFGQCLARIEPAYEIDKAADNKPKRLEPTGATRKKDTKGDVVSRVMDRRAVKAAADAALKQKETHKK